MLLFTAALCLVVASSAAAGNPPDGDVSGPHGGAIAPDRELLYVNGFRTSHEAAVETATQAGESLGLGAHLVWNDLTLVPVDAFAMAFEKLGNGDWGINAATNSLARRVDLNAGLGRQTWILAHSAGSLSVNNAIRRLSRSWSKLGEAERLQRLATVRLVTIGGAVFHRDHLAADGWPEEAFLFEVADARDGIDQVFGGGEWGLFEGAAHGAAAYLPHIDADCFASHGLLRIDGDGLLWRLVTRADDPAQVGFTVRMSEMPDEKNRRTPDIAVPSAWKRWVWSVTGHNDLTKVSFMPMRSEIPWDEAARDKPLGHGSVTHAIDFDYLGRVEGGIPEGGFLIHIKPREP